MAKALLFQPGRIGKLWIKNRIVFLAVNVGLTAPIEEGWLTREGIDFYEERAKGGAGLIITTFMRPSRRLEPSIGEPLVHSHLAAAWLNELAETVHDYGARLCVQLAPGLGRNMTPIPGLPHGGTVAPSPIPNVKDPTVISRELTREEIEQLIEDYEKSARIICQAGVDAIEIHAQQGYLLDQFMTAAWNKRTDRYGGDLEGRLTFAYELIRAVRRAAGPDFPILFRYALCHHFEGGRTVEEGLEIARRLEAAGVDALNINAGSYEAYHLAQPPTSQPRGCWVELAAAAKRVVKIPVIVGGKLGYPELAERVLQEGKADFIGLARYLLADPEWPNKVREGRNEDIIPCIGCHEGCIKRRRMSLNIGCAVNPRAGREKKLALQPASKKKFVMVVGGGPAGMEAARVAALRGHRVILWEQLDRLGGNLVPASVPDFKQDYRDLLNYLTRQVAKAGVEVLLGRKATPEAVREINPDALVVATGAAPLIPPIKGIDREFVGTGIDFLLGKKEFGHNVLVIGGGLVGCEAAIHLAEKGCRVVVVEVMDQVLHGMTSGYGIAPNPNRLDMLRLLQEKGVRVLTRTKVLEIADGKALLLGEKGDPAELEVDTVAVAVGLRPNNELFEALYGDLPEVYAVGDCVTPRVVLNAIWEGYRVARLI